jgi:hypothetical protein
MEINEDMRMCSFNVENMYTNIPKSGVINVITNALLTNPEIEKINQKEILHTLKTGTEQNYSQFDQQYCKQTEGLAIGAPMSAILAEEYWKKEHMEHKQIYQILIKHKIIGYFRYVDIFIIYDQRKTNIDETLTEFNTQQTNIIFTTDKNSVTLLISRSYIIP